MNNLRQLQLEFCDYLSHPQIGKAVAQHIVSDDKADADTRLAIYGDAYVLRLIGALRIDYPGVEALLGDEQFEAMGRAYVAAYPSRHPSIRWFGGSLVEFLRQTSPYCEHEILLEMAAFEWAKGEVFDGPNADFVSMDQLAAIDPEDWGQMQFSFVPAMRSLLLHNNVSLLWNAVQEEAESLPDLERSEDPVTWLIWRKAFDPNWRSLDVDESFAFEYARQGMTFGELCERLCEWVDEEHAPMRAVTFLKTWIDSEIVERIRFSE